MDYSKTTLENGVRVLTTPLPSLPSATVTVWVKTGSRMESDKVSGISHFLEHMVFKGSKKRPSAIEISQAVDAMGGEFNAGTSKEWTDFYIKARAESLPLAFDVLSDMVLAPLLKAEDIEREKGVIVEEMRMYEDTPMWRVGDVFEQLIFSGSTLGRDIIGTKDTVRGVKRDDFERYRSEHYYPHNIIVTVAGGIKEKEVRALAEKYFGALRGRNKGTRPTRFATRQRHPQVKLHSKKKDQAHLVFGFRGNPRGHKDRFTEEVLGAILGGGMSSRLFTEVREKRGLAYAVKTSSEHYIDTGYLATYAGVDVKKADDAIAVILSEHYKIIKELVDARELKKAKEYIKGHLALGLEDTKEVNSFFGEQELFLRKVETPEQVFKAIDKVSAQDVRRVANEFFKPQRLNLALIGPYKDQSRFEKLLK